MNDDEADDWPPWLVIVVLLALLFIAMVAVSLGLAQLVYL